MKPSVGRRFKRKHRLLSSLFISNPALVLGFDLPFIIATSTSLKNAVAMSVELFLIHIVTMFLAVVFLRKLALWLRAPLTVIISTGMMMLARELILFMFSDITNSLGMYIYLMAVNGLTLFQSLSLNKRSRPKPVLSRELAHTAAFATVMFVLSAIREYFGSGMLWGIAIPAPFKLSGLPIPFSGFILMGFLLAFIKLLNKALIGFIITEEQRREERYVIIRKRL